MIDRRIALLWIAVAIVAAVLLSGLVDQIIEPYSHHDDLDFLLPQGTPHTVNMLNKMHAEGRWLNYLWYEVTQHLTSSQGYRLYFIAAAILTAATAMIIGSVAAPLFAFAFVLGNPLNDIGLWGTTSAPGLLITAAAVCAIWLGHRPHRVLLLTLPLLLLTYPPFSQFVLFAYLVKYADRPWRMLARGLACYIVGYAAGVLIIHLINWLAFGHFGVAIEEWRKPNSLHTLEDLVINLRTLFAAYSAVVAAFTGMLIVGAIGFVVGVAAPASRRHTLILLGFSVFMLSIEAALTSLTGTSSDPRAYLWLWPACLAPWMFVLASTSRPVQTLAIGALLIVGLYSLNMTSSMLGDAQRTLAYEDAMVRTAQMMSSRPDPMIVLYGDRNMAPELRFPDEADQLHNYIKTRHGIDVVDCYPQDCEAIATRLAAGETTPFMLNGAVVFAFSK